MRAALTRLLPLAIALLATATPSAAQKDDDEEYDKLSPFTAARDAGDSGYEVRVGETWYDLVELDGIPAADVRGFCERTFGRRAEKRFAEDLVEVLARMDHEHDRALDLVLERLDDGERVVLDDVAMTVGNRRRCWEYRNSPEVPIVGKRWASRVAREHAAEVAAAYRHLAEPPPLAGGAGARLELARAQADLDQLEWHVVHEYSYRDLRGVDVEAAFDAARLGLGADAEVGTELLGLQLTKLLALFGDGHARLDLPVQAFVPTGYLPFLLEEAEGGVVAFRSDRSGLVDAEHPFLVAIDGRPLEEWLAVAGEVVARGAEHTVRWRSLRALRQLAWARLELGLPAAGEVVATLRDSDGATVDVTLPLADRRPVYGTWPRAEMGLLDGDVGYLRIARMDSDREFVEGLHAAMERFRDTRGLVIDVRGNGGGSRVALRELFPYLQGPDEAPRVGNVAAYRLRVGDAADHAAGYLDNRYLWPAAWAQWTDAERAAIDACAERFAPNWELPEGEFSAWHYMLLGSAASDRRPHYDRPVVVLLDTGCFSATDIFLGALADLPGVTLVGTPSGGGSGRSRDVELEHSGLGLRLSSMASFRPDGRRYDGLGVEPDELVLPAPGDLVGEGDAQLDAARALLGAE